MTLPDEPTPTVVPEQIRAWELPPGILDRYGVGRKLVLGGEILRTYVIVRWRLARHELREAVRTLREPAGDSMRPISDEAYVEAGRLAWAVQRTLRIVPTDSRCLMQSLVLLRLLARRGISSSLVIGVRPGEEEFEAHAWIEYCNLALLPGDQGVYESLTQL